MESKDVLHVPEANANLFSVNSATSHGFTVVMNNNNVDIKDNETINNKRYSSSIDNLYILNKRDINKIYTTMRNQENEDILELCPAGFAHQDKSKSKKVYRINNNNNHNFCDSCVLGKLHGLSYKSRKCKVQEIEEIISADVNWPIKVMSPGNNNYFVYFIDEYFEESLDNLYR